MLVMLNGRVLVLLSLMMFMQSAWAGNKIHGKVYNMQGPNAAAWDMTGKQAKYLTENDLHKDLINTTVISDRIPFFRRELKSGNGSTFIKIHRKKVAEASFESLTKLYTSSKPQPVIKNIKAGDIYLMKSGSTNDLVLLTISQIKDDRTSRLYGGNNLDYVAFEYEIFSYIPPQATSWNPTPESAPINIEPSVVIYPNPVKRNVHISLQNMEQRNWTVKIENTKGEMLYESVEPIQGKQWDHNISAFPSGRYILSLYADNEVYLQKVIDKENAALTENESEE
jgi:hypothetical protein